MAGLCRAFEHYGLDVFLGIGADTHSFRPHRCHCQHHATLGFPHCHTGAQGAAARHPLAGTRAWYLRGSVACQQGFRWVGERAFGNSSRPRRRHMFRSRNRHEEARALAHADADGHRLAVPDRGCAAALQDSTVPLRPIIRLLQKTIGIAGGAKREETRTQLEARLEALGIPTDTALPVLLELFGISSGDPAWDSFDPPDRRRHVTDAVLTVLIGESLAQHLVLVVEDLHFADSETRVIVEKLVENARSLPLLVLLSYRPEFEHDWEHQPQFFEQRLEPLRHVDALGLLEGHLGSDTSLDELKGTLIERTDGIPFFLGECILHVIDSGQLSGSARDYSLSETLEELTIPRSVHDVIASRIDHLQQGRSGRRVICHRRGTRRHQDHIQARQGDLSEHHAAR